MKKRHLVVKTAVKETRFYLCEVTAGAQTNTPRKQRRSQKRTGVNLRDRGSGDGFLDTTPRTPAPEEDTDALDFVKTELSRRAERDRDSENTTQDGRSWSPTTCLVGDLYVDL